MIRTLRRIKNTSAVEPLINGHFNGWTPFLGCKNLVICSIEDHFIPCSFGWQTLFNAQNILELLETKREVLLEV